MWKKVPENKIKTIIMLGKFYEKKSQKIHKTLK